MRTWAVIVVSLIVAPALGQDKPGSGGAAPGSHMTDVPASNHPCAAAAPSDSLSDKLTQCDGVIAPPTAGLDAGIRKPAPDPTPNTTPVIPPNTGTVVPK